jgi:hypothetical protein
VGVFTPVFSGYGEIQDCRSRIRLHAVRATIINDSAPIGKNLSLVRARRLR